jgi:hypothetical protein
MGSIKRKMRRQEEQLSPNSQRALDKLSQQLAGLVNSARAAGMEPHHVREVLLIYAATNAVEASLTEQAFSIEAVNAFVEERRELAKERRSDE